jgi:hypothetical protein
MIGGYVVSAWDGAFGLRGWQASFIIVGLPGILLAALVHLTVAEPVRGALDGTPRPNSPHPLQDVFAEIATMLPPWSFGRVRRYGGTIKERNLNICCFLGLIIAAVALTLLTDRALSPERRAPLFTLSGVTITTNLVQWIAMAIAIYACVSWIQAARYRNPLSHRLIIHSAPFKLLCGVCGLLGIFLYSIGAFVFSYAKTYLAFGPEMGVVLGAVAAISGCVGILGGGILADYFKRRHPAGRLYLLMVNVGLFAGFTAIQFTTPSQSVFLVAYAAALLVFTGWSPIMGASTQDLLPPELRGLGYGITGLATSIIGLGCGPYVVGFISDATGDLRVAILSMLAFAPLVIGLLWTAARLLPEQEQFVERRGFEETGLQTNELSRTDDARDSRVAATRRQL